jgi:hypothetical protein
LLRVRIQTQQIKNAQSAICFAYFFHLPEPLSTKVFSHYAFGRSSDSLSWPSRLSTVA